MANAIKGTHFQGPVLGSSAAKGGLLEDMPSALVDQVRSPYEVHVEDFNIEMADALLALSGFTLTDINTSAAAAEVIDASTGYLLIDAGTTDDSGSQIAFNIPAAGLTTANPQFDIMGSFVSTATKMDQQELFFETRVGFTGEAGVWLGKVALGWITTDTLCMTSATGALDIAVGGGMGFHVAEDGTLGYFSSNAAITTSTDSGVNVKTEVDALATGGTQWHTLGFRTKWDDASAGTGHTDFFIDGRKVGTIVGTQPMDATEVYAVTYEAQNGPAGGEVDLKIDWVISGRTRPGLSRPYTSGNW
jgi:hypothetical protein